MSNSNSLGHLMERNLLEVFGERNPTLRKIAISELYAEECTFFEADEKIVGRQALNMKVEQILQDAPGFAFHALEAAQVNHDHGRLKWQFGPPGSAPIVTGMDIAIFDQGRIHALYAFIDKTPSD